MHDRARLVTPILVALVIGLALGVYLGAYLGSAGSRRAAARPEPVPTPTAGTHLHREEFAALHATLAALQNELASLRADLPGGPTPEMSSPVPARQERPAPPPAPEPNTLALQDVQRDALSATFHFVPQGTNALDLFALVIRLPPDSGARITELVPLGTATYGEANQRISVDGRFAAFQGIPADLTPLRFRLRVDAPVTAMLSGTGGVKPFTIDFEL